MSIKVAYENRSPFDLSPSLVSNLTIAALTEGLRGGWSTDNQPESGASATLDFPDALVGGDAAIGRFKGLADFSNPSALEAIDRFVGEERGASPSAAALGNSPVWADTPALELIEHHDC